MTSARRVRLCTGCLAGAMGLAMALATTPSVDAQQPRKSWTDNGGGPDNSHYVAIDQITKTNVSQLEVAWTYPTVDNSGSLFNPVVVDNVMYVLGRNNSLAALDATDGHEIWVHEGLQGIARRGINYWESKDRRERRLLFQMNHTLQAIDAFTGQSILSFGTDGFVDLRAGLRRNPQDIYRIQSNNPGKVFEDLLILGSVTGEGYMSPPGDLRAFDVRTGKVVWQFHTVPHPGEYGYNTWPKQAWEYAGGVNTWGEITIDDRRGIAYFPLGSSTYDFYGADRQGANLFANCLLALDARTGKRLWHQQLIHHDLWDYDLVSAPQLITVRRNGRTIDAVAQAGKHGFLYVFDRVTGRPVFPITERSAPASDVEGEHAFRTQPVPSLPPFARQKFTADDVNPYLPAEERAGWIEFIKRAVNRGLYTPPALQESVQMPGNRGGSNWGTTSADPARGLAYIMSIDAPAILKLDLSLPAGAPGPFAAAGGRGRGAPASPGQAVYQQACESCHGANRQGVGTAPGLAGVTERLGEDGVVEVIRTGRGQMPGFGIGDVQLGVLVAYLATPVGGGGGRGGGRGGGPAIEARPIGGVVVAAGGAPAAQAFVKTMPQGIPTEYGPHGGPAYPAGIATPMMRFYTGWNVMRNIVSPPWSTLTAYDLNKGTIKWQIPIGEDPQMVAQGIRNTGIMQEQRAVIVTPTGVLFASTSDGYLRALDGETGAQLWSVRLPANGGGIPAMYEVSGRAYIVVPTGGGAAGATTAQAPARPTPGYVAFALPQARN